MTVRQSGIDDSQLRGGEARTAEAHAGTEGGAAGARHLRQEGAGVHQALRVGVILSNQDYHMLRCSDSRLFLCFVPGLPHVVAHFSQQ